MPEEKLPPVPLSFVIVVFTVAIVVGVAVAWLGMTGRIGAGIP